LDPVGDIQAMSAHAIQILGDDAVHREFRRRAKEQARKFDIQHIVPQYEALYDMHLQLT
jgi:hypothetical protein